jgi:hypothetical protein
MTSASTGSLERGGMLRVLPEAYLTLAARRVQHQSRRPTPFRASREVALQSTQPERLHVRRRVRSLASAQRQ